MKPALYTYCISTTRSIIVGITWDGHRFRLSGGSNVIWPVKDHVWLRPRYALV